MGEFDLSSFCKTKPQATDFANRLAAIAESVYRTNFNLETELMNQFGLQKKDKFMVLLRDNKIAIESHSALKEFLTKIAEQAVQLPVLSLTLAFEPKEQTLKIVSDWFLLDIKKQFLFDVHVDPSIIGGSMISFKGKYIDYSLKPRFEKIMSAVLTPQPAKPPQTLPNAHQDLDHLHLGR